MDVGRPQEAERALNESLNNFGPKSRNIGRAATLFSLGTLNARRKNYVAARDFTRQQYEMFLSNFGPHFRPTLEALMLWERNRALTGQAADALQPALLAMQELRGTYPPMAKGLWNNLQCLAAVQNAAGDFNGALAASQESLEIYNHSTWNAHDPRRAQNLLQLAISLRGLHKYREAEPLLREAQSIYAASGPMWLTKSREIADLLAVPEKPNATKRE